MKNAGRALGGGIKSRSTRKATKVKAKLKLKGSPIQIHNAIKQLASGGMDRSVATPVVEIKDESGSKK